MNSVFNLSQLALITVQGEKAQTFLQGQLTCDLREISEQHSRLSAHCNHKGRMLATLRVIFYQQQYHLLLPAIMVEAAMKELKKYALLARVVLTENKNDYSILGCHGPDLSQTLSQFFETLPTAADIVQQQDQLLIIRICNTQERYLILGPRTTASMLHEQLLTKLTRASDDTWQLLDIQAGIANIYPETMNLFTPQMLNYPALNAVSFKKGCYIGQEVIARTHYLGKAKRHLHLASIQTSTLPPPGSALSSKETSQEVGQIVAAAFHSPEECQLLAVIQDEALNGEIFWQEKAVTLTYSKSSS